MVSSTPGPAERIREDWQPTARFYARFGGAATAFRHDIADGTIPPGQDVTASALS